MKLSTKIYRKAFHLSSDLLYSLKRKPHQQTHASSTPLPSPDLEVVQALQTKGTCVTSLDALNIPNTKGFWSSAKAIAHELRNVSGRSRQGFRIEASASQLMTRPEIICWGLEERLLAIVERYLKTPVSYCGVVLRRDVANAVKRGTRLWHRDIEDRRMCKVIVYLNDVNAQKGPFAYINRDALHGCRALKSRYGYIRDQIMTSYLPSFRQNACIGSKGTIIFCDTATVFHRGMVPVKGDRLAAFFTYVSRNPRSPWKCRFPFRRDELATIAQRLSRRQQQSIFWRGAISS